MSFKSWMVAAGLIAALATPTFAGRDAEKLDADDLRYREKVREQMLGKFPSQRVVNSVQARLPQAEIANLLTLMEDATRGTGPITAADAGRIEDELARQKQFWLDEYRRSLQKGAAGGDLESFGDAPRLDRGFDELFSAAIGSSKDDVTPDEYLVIYQEYDSLSQTFQQLKLARFLSANRDGVARFQGPKPDHAETAAIAQSMDESFLPGYQKRLSDGVATLRKILVAGN